MAPRRMLPRTATTDRSELLYYVHATLDAVPT